MRRLLTTVAAAVLLAGCSAAPELAPTPAPATATVQSHSAPAQIVIPALGVTDNVVPVGLQQDGALEIPDVDETGWYRGSPIPGSAGPALLAGHVNWNGKAGALARIGQLHAGDRVDVASTDGSTVRFAVYEVARQVKTAIDWRAVLADTAGPELILVTCSGRVVDHEYDSNTIVRARIAL